jgi:DNA repair protein RadC
LVIFFLCALKVYKGWIYCTGRWLTHPNYNPAEAGMETLPLLGVEVIQVSDKKITSTKTGNSVEVNKSTGLPETSTIEARALGNGAENLTNQELLGVIMSGEKEASNAAANLLNTFDGNIVFVVTASIEQLMQVEGIGSTEACQIKAAFELSKRINAYCDEKHPKITSKDDVTKLLAPHMMFLPQEEFKVVLLDSKQKLIRFATVSVGSLDKALVEPRDVFRPAIASGDPKPSEQDILLTRELIVCGKILGVEVLDHIIIGVSNHVSFRESKLM